MRHGCRLLAKGRRRVRRPAAHSVARLESDAEETERLRLRAGIACRAAPIDTTRAELEQAQSTVDRRPELMPSGHGLTGCRYDAPRGKR
jgi:hypothetical protein